MLLEEREAFAREHREGLFRVSKFGFQNSGFKIRVSNYGVSNFGHLAEGGEVLALLEQFRDLLELLAGFLDVPLQEEPGVYINI